MTTATEIITEAMRHLGMLNAGETPNADDADACLTALNTLVDAWNLPSLTQYTTTDGTANLAGGATSLTIGPGQTINVTRPGRIEVGSWARAGDIDYELEQITEAEYNAISIKNLAGFVPRVFYYDPGTTTGTIYYWPAPAATVVVHHPLALQFTAFANLTTDYSFPQGYRRAFVFNLAKEVAPMFTEQGPSPFVVAQAALSLRLVKRANHQVPQLDTYPRPLGAYEDFVGGYSV